MINLEDEDEAKQAPSDLMTETERADERMREWQIEMDVRRRIAQDALLNQTRAIMRCDRIQNTLDPAKGMADVL